MTAKARRILYAAAFALVGAALFVSWRFDIDMQRARAHAAQGSVLVATRCGPIEYQEIGTGKPLLAVHGSGGGHDQGMAFASGLAAHGIRVIAMSRLGIPEAAFMGGSAGAPSALQMAIRHPDRVSALVLLVPLAYKPPTQANSAPPLSPSVEALMMRVIGSDFLFWSGIHVARDQVIKVVLATPPELLAHASPQERARIDSMIDNILPVSQRAVGLRSDTASSKHLQPAALESIHMPTLVISVRDDRYGTYASAKYTSEHIAGAKFIGFDQGGHTWVGHDEEVQAAIVELLMPTARP